MVVDVPVPVDPDIIKFLVQLAMVVTIVKVVKILL